LKVISHRGNLHGPRTCNENSPESVEFALIQGFECEIDIWFDENHNLLLGHDLGIYPISIPWIVERSNKLWIHCKNLPALIYFQNLESNLNYFWHENDRFTLTSLGYIWSYPDYIIHKDSISVLPEKYFDLSKSASLPIAQGFCTDFPILLAENLT